MPPTPQLGRTLGIPNAFLLWLALGAITLWLLHRTVYGRYLYAMGNSQRALFLAGARVRTVTVCTFVLAELYPAWARSC